MRRSIRGMMAGLLTVGSLSIFSLSAALPAQAAQVRDTVACQGVQVTMGTVATPQCLLVAQLPQHVTNVTQICNMDPAKQTITFVDDETAQSVNIAPNTCKTFSNQAGMVNPQ